MQSITLLSDSVRSFQTNLVDGITANEERIRESLVKSLMLGTALNTHIVSALDSRTGNPARDGADRSRDTAMLSRSPEQLMRMAQL